MGRYKVKLEQRPTGSWSASLFEDPPGEPLRNLHVVVVRPSRKQALDGIRQARDRLNVIREPEWVTLDEVPEPQSLRAV